MNDTLSKQFDFLNRSLERRTPIRLLSYGEGELAFLFDKNPGSEREVFVQSVQRELYDAAILSKEENVFLTTLLGTEYQEGDAQRCADFRRLLEANKVTLKEELWNAKIFYEILFEIAHTDREAISRTETFLRLLSRYGVTIVGPRHLVEAYPLLRGMNLIETPSYGATCWIDRIVRDITSAPRTKAYLFACGVSGNVLVHRLSSFYPDSHLLDVGAFFDIGLGIGTRALKELPTPPLLQFV